MIQIVHLPPVRNVHRVDGVAVVSLTAHVDVYLIIKAHYCHYNTHHYNTHLWVFSFEVFHTNSQTHRTSTGYRARLPEMYNIVALVAVTTVSQHHWPTGCGSGGPSPCGGKPCLPKFPHTYDMQKSTVRNPGKQVSSFFSLPANLFFLLHFPPMTACNAQSKSGCTMLTCAMCLAFVCSVFCWQIFMPCNYSGHYNPHVVSNLIVKPPPPIATPPIHSTLCTTDRPDA